MSGKYSNDSQDVNKPYISVTLETFHLEISGKEVNDLQLVNKFIHIINI